MSCSNASARRPSARIISTSMNGEFGHLPILDNRATLHARTDFDPAEWLGAAPAGDPRRASDRGSVQAGLIVLRRGGEGRRGRSGARHAGDQVGGLLGDHDDGGVDVAADQIGHYGGIGHAQAPRSRVVSTRHRPPRLRRFPCGRCRRDDGRWPVRSEYRHQGPRRFARPCPA